MPDPSQLLLLDFFHLALLMLGFGLLLYALIRRSNPLIRWHEHGNVWTDPFQTIDLLFGGVLIAIFYAATRAFVLSTEPLPDIKADTATIWRLLLMQILTYVALIGGLLFILAYARRVNLSEVFGLKRLPPRRVLLWSVGAMLVTVPIIHFIAIGWIGWLEHAFGEKQDKQQMVEAFKDSAELMPKILIAVSAVVVAPIAEEILFRGYLYPVIKRFSERFFAALVVSVIFAAIHNNTGSVVPLIFLAMMFTVAYELTGCLLVPIGMHMIFNALTIFALFGESGGG